MIHLTSLTQAKTLLRTVVLALCGFLCTARAAADTFQIDGMIYETTSDTTCTVTQGIDSTVVVIPQEVSYLDKSYIVTAIGASAFIRSTNLTTIELPAALTSIGFGAFYGCSSLKSIAFPTTLTSIGEYTYYGCTSLTNIELPTALTSIGRYAFHGCSSLTNIVFPTALTSIGKGAFSGCTSLSSILIPSSVTTIGAECFSLCTGLKEIQVESENSNYQSADGILFNKDLTTLLCYPSGKEDNQYAVPNTVTTIDTFSFYGNDILQTIQIPAATNQIEATSFRFCGKLQAFEIAADNEHYQSEDGVLFDKGLTTLYVYPHGKESTEYTIPSSVTSIEEYAFYNCSNLRNIDMPSSLTSIEAYAFHSCSNLSNIDLPTSLTSIEADAFAYCSNLLYVQIPDSVTYIGRSAFYGCSNLIFLEIPSSVTTIGESAFNYCKSLQSIASYATNPIEAPSSIFHLQTHLRATLYVPEEAITAYQSSSYCWSNFRYIKPLSEYAHGLPVTVYDDEGTSYYISKDGVCSVQKGVDSAEVTIPQEVSYLGKTYTVTEIGERAFWSGDSYALTSIELPSTIRSIGNYAFSGCQNLQSLTIPDSVLSIGHYAFRGCTSLTKANIPSGITTIEEGTFYSCQSLQSITIPSSVTTLGDVAFAYCHELNTVVIPISITTIGTGCFAGCSGLKEIQVESANSNYQSVDGILFNKDQTTLLCYPSGKEDKQYAVPNTVTTIDANAFSGNDILQTIQIPTATSRIGGMGKIFCNCYQLEAIHVAADNEHYQSEDGVLFDKGLKTLYVYPQGKTWTEYTIPSSVTSIEEYTFYRNIYLESIKIPASVTTIGRFAFAHCQLNNVELPKALITIGSYAFSGCRLLSRIEIPASVTTIGEWAFYGCNNVQSIEISKSVTTIGDRAFDYCDSLTSVVCYATDPIAADVQNSPFYTQAYNRATLYVPEEAITAYRTTSYCWSNFQNIKPLSEYTSLQTVPLSGEASESAVIYDLKGVRVDGDTEHLAPGFYLVRQGDKSRKILVK